MHVPGPSPFGKSPIPEGEPDNRAVFFFDIDNCLYSKSINVIRLMQDLIHEYFTTHLSLTPADARKLHREYYLTYGLALEGLVRHHRIDPLKYNSLVDDALPLAPLLHPSAPLRRLLLSLDRTKIKPWLFTNAYVNHGLRVIKLLGIADCFEGITYCDYAESELVCKPKPESYLRAMRDAGLDVGERDVGGRCYFVDDSGANCSGAAEAGWGRVVMKLEGEEKVPRNSKAGWHVKDLEELRQIFPEIFTECPETEEEATRRAMEMHAEQVTKEKREAANGGVIGTGNAAVNGAVDGTTNGLANAEAVNGSA